MLLHCSTIMMNKDKYIKNMAHFFPMSARLTTQREKFVGPSVGLRAVSR